MGRDNATACNRELGAELRKRREAAGLTGAAVADYTGWDRSKVSRVESGHIGVNPVDTVHYLGACHVWAPDAREILDLSETAQRKPGYWLSPKGARPDRMFSTLTFHESTASSLICYDTHVVHGLVQTRDYARALFNTEARRDADDVTHCVELRIARQQILNRPRPATFTFFVHETALRREVGGRDVLQEQLLHLVLLAALPHVTLRVIPASTPTPDAVGGPFQLFTWPQHRPLVYLDNACGLFLEDEEFVTPFRDLVRLTAAAALDEAPSRERVASVANELDQANEDHGGIHGIHGEGRGP